MNAIYKIKPGFIMRTVSGANMVVAIGPASREFKGMIRLNESGAWIFEQMRNGIKLDTLVEKMVERYDELDKDTAKKDILDFVEKIHFAIKIDEI